MPNNLTRDRLPLARHFRPRLLSAAIVAAGQALYSLPAMAGPEGGQVRGGDGTIEYNGKVTTIEQLSDRLAVDWDSFDVSADEVVNFQQPGAQSIALNRIMGHNGSEILGQINANGRVVLVNPRGIVFGEGAQVNVGGMLASGLDIGVDDFMAGDLAFSALEGAEGRVVNQGLLQAATGGSITLLGKQVSNEGLISAHLGSINLAAGKEAVVTFDPDGLMGVRVTRAMVQDELGAEAALSNSGTLEAQGGQILLTASTSQEIFSQAVNRGNHEQANSVVVHEDGSFTLGAGADVVNTGHLDVSSGAQSAGEIAVLGENITHSGEANASGTGQAASGHIEFHAQDTALLTGNAVLSANSQSGKGGTVKVLGYKVGLMDDSLLDASGKTGGGEILLGGDYKGGNVAIRNAWRTYVGPSASLKANALETGDGGRIIVWADDITRYYGSLEGKGTGALGKGGFAEVSGKRLLDFDGRANLSGLAGVGTLLLDPQDITIFQGNLGDGNDSDVDGIAQENTNETKVPFGEKIGTNNDNSARFTSLKIVTLLKDSDVVLEATRDIFVESSIDVAEGGIPSNTNNLTLKAGDDIQVDSEKVISMGAGDIRFYAGVAGCGGSCSYEDGVDDPNNNLVGRNIDIQGELNTTGNIVLNAADNVTINKAVGGSGSPSAVSIRAGNNIDLENGAAITTATGSSGDAISLFASDALLTNETGSDNHVQLQGSDYSEGNLITRGALNSNGGNIFLNARGAIELRANATTLGGDFTVGSVVNVDGTEVVQGPTRFSSNFDVDGNPVLIDAGTSSNEQTGVNSGNILIYTSLDDVGEGGSVDLGSFSIQMAYLALDEVSTDGSLTGGDSVGSVTVSAAGNITLNEEWNFNDSNPRGYNGEGGEALGTASLSLTAGGDISLNGGIYDAYADGRDSLNITLTAGDEGTITLADNVFTAGGNFTASASTLTLGGRVDTRNANQNGNNNGEAYGGGENNDWDETSGQGWTTGGNITLNVDNDLEVKDLVTIRDCLESLSGICEGDLTISSRSSGSSISITQYESSGSEEDRFLDISGATHLDLGSGDAILTAGNNLLGGDVTITSANDVTIRQNGDISINVDSLTGALSVDTSGKQGAAGGNITVATVEQPSSDHLTLGRINSNGGDALSSGQITEQAGQSGGKITVTAASITLNGDVTSKGTAEGGTGAGHGASGAITFQGDLELTQSSTSIDASSESEPEENSANVTFQKDVFGDGVTTKPALVVKGATVTFGGEIGTNVQTEGDDVESSVGTVSVTSYGDVIFKGSALPSLAAETATVHVEGLASAEQSLTASNRSNTWKLYQNASGEGDSNTLNDVITFTGFDTLSGGDQADHFEILTSGAAYSLNGGTGANKLTGFSDADNLNEWSVSATGGSLLNSGKTVSFSNIQTLMGGAGEGGDSLTGPDDNNRWTLASAGSGAVQQDVEGETEPAYTYDFANMETLTGNAGSDHFVVTESGVNFTVAG
ncbi:filamentous hemagglutinin N-terminal domain-containing protein, partial [Marinimicrobium agarilyticum]|uniref:two-partner secretion domain-containing protein n=1 Tax=Marinimicrobium agarilyticum TaxID=306546 RepID=UPI0004813E3A